MNKEEIKKEFTEKWRWDISYQKESDLSSIIADWWLSKLDTYKSSLLERIDKSRKRTVSKEHYPQITDNKINDRAIYNQAIDDIINLIKEGIE